MKIITIDMDALVKAIDCNTDANEQDAKAIIYKVGFVDNPDELSPREYLASRAIDAWFAQHGQLTWQKAIEITAIITKMPDEERDRLLAME